MKYNIRKFDALTTLELYEILKLRNEVFVVEQTCPYQDCDGKDINAIHLCVYDPTLVGYLRILLPGAYYDEAAIGRVVIHTSHRKTGLGRDMMSKAIAYMGEHNMLPIRISAQAYLQKFYEGLGFEKVSDIYLEDDIEHMEMLLK